MVVESSKYRMEPYDCNGNVIDFIFNFRIFVVDDLKVYLNDTLLTYGTHYEVFKSGGNFQSGGTVQTVQIYPAGSTITIIREINISSSFDVEEAGALPSAGLENGFDRLAMICLQLAAKIGRGIVLPILEESTMELPSIAERATKFLSFGLDGSISMKGLAEIGTVTADESSIVLSSAILSIKDGGVNLAKLAQEVTDYITAEAGAIVDIHDATAAPHSGKFAAAGHLHDGRYASNPNLLINGGFLIWQRGETFSMIANAFSVDHWLTGTCSTTGTITKNTDGNIQLDFTSDGQFQYLNKIEDFQHLLGKTVTMSVRIKTDTPIFMYIGTEIAVNSTNIIASNEWQEINIIGTIPIDSTHLEAVLSHNSISTDESVQIEWCKMELSSVVTPFEQPDYNIELLKCSRYYRHINAWWHKFDDDAGTYTTSLMPMMRVIPTVIISGFTPTSYVATETSFVMEGAGGNAAGYADIQLDAEL